ncbi:50S ribosomal protein L13 [Candidatus Latescibacteria bacterium]|jgi:large subunit ribosomal protein L13|nr:50S ribosomal protein L13 [Candidatus Latescibacterota bacterium]
MNNITYTPKAGDVERLWFVVDATDKVLGRLASEIAQVLRGKRKPQYAPHADVGDHVIVINAEKIKITGNKAEQKVYYRHTGYPGGLRTTPYRRMQERHPDRIIRKAVQGMLPHTKLGRLQLKKLRVYAGGDHRHEAQNPQPLEL